MATALVDRPMSTLNEIPASPHRRRRRTSTVEIIDVDLTDEVTNVPSRPVRSQERTGIPSPDIISIVDSDDDDLHLSRLAQPVAPGSNRVRARPVAGQRPRLFSPPPPPQDPTIPDVPRVPQRYAGLTSLPMRLHPPPFPSPPVRPRDQPFEFEANIPQAAPVAGPSNGNHNRNRRVAISPPELTAAPPSHHTPAMGLGGGLISLNRAQSNIQRRDHLRQHPNDRGVMGRASSAMRRFYSAITGHDDDDNQILRSHHEDHPAVQMFLAHDLGLLPAGDDDDDRFGHPARPYVWQEILSRGRGHGRARNQEEDYKPEYTHPGKPESGFTFDFAPPSSTEASSSHAKGKAAAPPIIIDLEADMETDIPSTGSSGVPSSPSGPSSFQTLLVCAKCLDPLVLGAGLVGEEVRASKVWALRCGHLIDGKCLDLVGVPDTGHVDLDKGNDVEEGKGKARVVDFKGKGKAKALEEPSSSPEANPIRSRLRSRTNGHPPTSSLSPAPSSRSTRVLATQPAQVLLGKRKRTSSSLKNKLEVKHEWECPVAGCKRVHVSVQMEGVWVPEPATPVPAGKGKNKWSLARSEVTGGRGAVAVYV